MGGRMKRFTEKRDVNNVIPLRNAVCGIDMPYWRITRSNSLESFLYGDAADRLAVCLEVIVDKHACSAGNHAVVTLENDLSS